MQKATIAGGAMAAAVITIVATLALFFIQGSEQVAPALGIDEDNNNNKDAGYNNNSASVNPVYKAAATATSLECHRDDSPPPAETTTTTKTVVISAKLADRSDGRGIPDKQVIFTILPGNPVATLPTDASGQASISLNSSEFNAGRHTLFIFFDGDRGYEFSSCRIDIMAPQAPAGETALANG
ncbi:MAG TPA: hypothetical protein VHA09_09945 [Nitrososphaera sp.]|nr:hypothetical protein [Nitrososphaera sp.]